MIELFKYTRENKAQWDQLIQKSRNGTFLFLRDYLDYHSDRFKDYSFIITKKGRMEAVMPGNQYNNSFYSHQGLTYGGLVSSVKISTNEVIKIFDLLNEELQKNNIQEVIYKPIPLIYHRIPAQEDLYALFLNKAEKIACNISSTIFQNNKIPFIESRKSGIRKSIKEGVKIIESNDFASFWQILNTNLVSRFNKKPVHSLVEIIQLYERFPNNIKLYAGVHQDAIIACTLLFIMENIVHVQYISANEKGKEIGALDLLFEQLINKEFKHVPVFDFGHSTENMGFYLNENLIFQKEGFGGRGITYETYKYTL